MGMLESVIMTKRESIDGTVKVRKWNVLSCPYVSDCNYTCLGSPDSMSGCHTLASQGWEVDVRRPLWTPAVGYDGHLRP